jgi:exodeoxyribonuclease V alpha subunit
MLPLDEMIQDSIHYAFGEAFSDINEIKSLFALVSFASSLGHVCVPIDQFESQDQERILNWIKITPPQLIGLSHDSISKPLYFIDNCLYLHKNLKAETLLLHELVRLCSPSFHNHLQYEPDPELNHNQNEAVSKALCPGLLILTGGPGTGKTYTAKKIVRALLKERSSSKKSIILTAPTAKALAQLKKSIGDVDSDVELIADTLHKLTDFKTKKLSFLKASCIIVDEASMIEAPLMAKFFSSVSSQSKVVLIGDPFQLPPVGVGSFFQDMIEIAKSSSMFRHVHLEQVLRCQDLDLITLAQLTHEASFDAFLKFLDKKSDNISVISKPMDIYEGAMLHELIQFFSKEIFYLESLEKLAKLKLKSIILSTLRQGPLGVDNINNYLSSYFLHKNKEARFYIEPIMILENNRDLNLFNGETGWKIYDRIHKSHFYMIKNQKMESLKGTQYSAAFALSVHKSQGSEYDHVLFMVPPGSEKFSREIVYTAITRVKKTLTLWVDKEPLRIALSKKNHRYSSLKRRTRGYFLSERA